MDYRAFLLSPQGRINRQPFWMFGLLTFVVTIAAAAAGAAIDEPLANLVNLVLLWPSLMTSIKRCHDRDRSGWFLLVLLVPFVNLWVLIELYFLPGTVGPNAYGPDPRGVTSLVYAT